MLAARVWLALLATLALAIPAAAAPVRVFAASSLTEAMNDVADAYAKTGRARPTLVFGASSALARQIEAGAPASIFFSADEAWMDHLADRKLIAAGTRLPLLGNRLVLIVPAGSPRRVATIAIRPGFGFAGLIGDGRWATGDPDAVPVGRYARQALIRLGVWAAAEGRLARAENVRAALAFVETGAARAGIVYATDARASGRVAVAGTFPASSHDPIVYPAALLGTPDAEARAFFSFMRDRRAKRLYAARGFIVR